MAPPCAALRALSTEGAMTVVVVVVLITCAGVVRSATGRTRLAALPVAKSSADVGCVLRPSSEALLFAVLSSRRPGRDGRDRWARKKERKGSGVVERAEREKEAEGKEKARKKRAAWVLELALFWRSGYALLLPYGMDVMDGRRCTTVRSGAWIRRTWRGCDGVSYEGRAKSILETKKKR